jgi:hypothetical protein
MKQQQRGSREPGGSGAQSFRQLVEAKPGGREEGQEGLKFWVDPRGGACRIC